MLFFASFCLFIAFGNALGDCSVGCKEPTLMYEGLNCKPLFLSPNDCCPVEYDCSHIEERARANDEKCYFHGKAYSSGESVDRGETYGNCKVGCFCSERERGTMGFTCAMLDCPEWLHGSFAKPGCHQTYQLDKCCSTGEACPPFNATCEVNGETYHEGERFDAPDAKCTRCVCQQGFADKFEAPFCKKRSCIDEIKRQTEVNNFCAPSYISLDDCCPFAWHCPENDTIVSTEKPPSRPLLKCKFGDKTLNVGDRLERTSGSKGKLSCECRIPPYLTCIQNYEYSK